MGSGRAQLPARGCSKRHEGGMTAAMVDGMIGAVRAAWNARHAEGEEKVLA